MSRPTPEPLTVIPKKTFIDLISMDTTVAGTIRLFQYRPGTTIKRILIANLSSADHMYQLFYRTAGTVITPSGNPIGRTLPVPAGNGSASGFNTGDFGPLDIEDDGQARIGIIVKTTAALVLGAFIVIFGEVPVA